MVNLPQIAPKRIGNGELPDPHQGAQPVANAQQNPLIQPTPT
jgi:hypothetical protein